LKEIWCFSGLQLYYNGELEPVTYFPSVQASAHWLNSKLPNWGPLDGVVACLVLTGYAILFCSVIGPAFQIFIVQTVQAIVGTFQSTARSVCQKSTEGEDAKLQNTQR